MGRHGRSGTRLVFVPVDGSALRTSKGEVISGDKVGNQGSFVLRPPKTTKAQPPFPRQSSGLSQASGLTQASQPPGHSSGLSRENSGLSQASQPPEHSCGLSQTRRLPQE